MKKYVLYPGVGKILPSMAVGYISGKQLAHCYRVPYSECLDTSIPAVKKVISSGKGIIHLLNLIPNYTGIYELPDNKVNKIILSEGLHEAVNKNG